MIRTRSKISIIGAGFVGAATAYAIAMKGIVSEIVLIDMNEAKAEGEALDIAHGLSFMGEMWIHDGTYEDVKDSDIIIITAGANRKPGEARLDLAKKNVAIVRDITKNIMKYYNSGVIMCVTNPVDIITYVVQKESGLPKGTVFGTGAVLDTVRFRYLLSEVVGVDVRNVHGYIAGEHGDSQFPVWSSVRVAGIALDDYCKANNIVIDKQKVEDDVKYAGAEVIKRKGATYYAIASVVAKIAEAVIKDQRAILNVTSLVNGEYGLDDLCISFSSVVGRSGVERIIEFDFADDEREKLAKSAEAIKRTLSNI